VAGIRKPFKEMSIRGAVVNNRFVDLQWGMSSATGGFL
jgi:hypothetical protein